ncbi:hypothetical protein BDN70DRAFT_118623 [Pholiota conissans]|uniref:Uncharacterized protein n=1 Tax=Pholiota conissans TaxID=109636 RepID=A0A9P5YWT6_9AGAR|nr:hypothetical protein BDN70DRAFT_118623 [Pholiota conissans]
MSETSSDSPSVVIHPISPSSSLSSALSEPHSDPTSDEEPDLGAFNAVLREWTHLQPPPRIPIQIRSATSSTTPTFQPSVTGSDIRSEHSINTRISALSGISSFTRPPSSSAQPDGSTVWAQAPIASYLLSVTPSNDDEEGSPGGEGEYTPNSMASTGLTVEIESETDFDESNGRVESSPYPFPSDFGVSGVAMPVPLQVETTRIDSRETEHLEEASSTSVDRTFTVTTIRSVGDTESRLTSVQLQSQLRPTPTTEPSTSSLSNYASHSPAYPSNRSRNPIPPRTVSDSSVTTSGSASSSDLSLISYQISEAPSLPLVEESSSISASTDSSSIASTSMGLKTQRSMPTTASASTASLGTQRPQQQQQQFQPQVAPSDASNLSSTGSPLINPYSSVGFGSPLPNPYSPLPMPTSEPPAPLNHNRRPMLRTVWRQDIVDDLGTPDQPPSETLLFEPPRQWQKEFQPIVDDNDEDIQDMCLHTITLGPQC